MIKAFNSFGYLGYIGVAPGSVASLAALGLGWLLHAILGPFLLIGLTIAVFFLALRTINLEMHDFADPDMPHIVIDELIGQWIAMTPVFLTIWWMGAAHPWPLGANLIFIFIAFRFFDILKPYPANYFDRMKTSLGVLMDDVIAGLFAALAFLIAVLIAYGISA